MTQLLNSPDARAALFAGGLSGGLLAGAYIFQYGFGYVPCTMCYWQRYAHMAVLAASAGIIFARAFGGLPRKLAALILILLLLVSVGLALYHVGVELKWLEGPKACAAGGSGNVAIDPNNPLAGLDAPIKAPSCADVAWSFLGLSMAGWNALISLIGIIGVWYLGLRTQKAKS